ncbi:Hypothetical protein CINCED_3A000830 [Cinara cedri]|uniref:Uncharacterized protein n=1 Tax=Cinara cedri TaxID=506608 RepID=A0A5E4MPN7_9HEMI|nr:Hypothetical protein CINCED_3A000830 [Cinara cedri]
MAGKKLMKLLWQIKKTRDYPLNVVGFDPKNLKRTTEHVDRSDGLPNLAQIIKPAIKEETFRKNVYKESLANKSLKPPKLKRHLNTNLKEKSIEYFDIIFDLYSGNIDNVTNVINEHLTNLEKLFNRYFPEDIRVNYEWTEQPFAADIMTVNVSTDIENQLIVLSCDNKSKQMFCETLLEIFWAHLCTGNYAELKLKTELNYSEKKGVFYYSKFEDA